MPSNSTSIKPPNSPGPLALPFELQGWPGPAATVGVHTASGQPKGHSVPQHDVTEMFHPGNTTLVLQCKATGFPQLLLPFAFADTAK